MANTANLTHRWGMLFPVSTNHVKWSVSRWWTLTTRADERHNTNSLFWYSQTRFTQADFRRYGESWRRISSTCLRCKWRIRGTKWVPENWPPECQLVLVIFVNRRHIRETYMSEGLYSNVAQNLFLDFFLSLTFIFVFMLRSSVSLWCNKWSIQCNLAVSSVQFLIIIIWSES